MSDAREALIEVAYMQIATEKMLTITPTGPGRASVPPHWRAEAEERAKPWIDAILAAGWTPPGERVTHAQRTRVADEIWDQMVGVAKSSVREAMADAFEAAGIEVPRG